MSHIQVVQSPMNRRQQIPNSKQQHYFVPQPQKRPAAHQINLSVGALPTQTSPQTFQGKQNFSPVNNSYQQHPVQIESKQRVKEMTSDLARLKKQLNDIMVDADKKKSFYEERRHNRSSDNLYAPSQRLSNGTQDKSALNSPRFQKFPTLSFTKNEKPAIESFREKESLSQYTYTKPVSAITPNYHEKDQVKEDKVKFERKPGFTKEKYDVKQIKIQKPVFSLKSQVKDNIQQTKIQEVKIVVEECKKPLEKERQCLKCKERQQKGCYACKMRQQKGCQECKMRQTKGCEKCKQRQEKGCQACKQRQQKGCQNCKERQSQQDETLFKIKNKYEEKQLENQQQINELRISVQNLRHQNEFMKGNLQQKTERLNELTIKNKQLVKYKEENEEKQVTWKEKIAELENQLITFKSEKKSKFDLALREQLEETAYFKSMIESKNQEICHLNETILMNKRQTDNALNDTKVEKVKHFSELKQERQKSDIMILNKENQIKTLKIAMNNMENKLKTAILDNKQKDDFIQTHLVGRMKFGEEQEYVQNILSKYQIDFPVNSLLEKLLQEQKMIEELKARLGEK